MALLVGELLDGIVYLGDEDLALGCNELAKQRDEVYHRLVHDAPEGAGVQVARGPGDCEFVVRDTAQAVGQAGCARVEPVVI